jgi:hypothetical protein
MATTDSGEGTCRSVGIAVSICSPTQFYRQKRRLSCAEASHRTLATGRSELHCTELGVVCGNCGSRWELARFESRMEG